MQTKAVSALFALVAAFAIAFASARAESGLGPPVGAPIPHDLAATDAQGRAQSFDSLVGERGMALFFVRSVDWCPFCRGQAQDIHEARAEFAERGLSVAFVSYDPVEKQARFIEETGFAPALLSDEGSKIIDAFGLRNEAHKSGRFAGIPHPAVFIVAPDRTILAKLYEEDYATNDKSYRNRPTVEAILKAADAALDAREQAAYRP
ncbi:MAG: hypothetical protein Kow00133_09770 [Amphiplicatus sp.]|jgi:peroxiredoxin Q/BCP